MKKWFHLVVLALALVPAAADAKSLTSGTAIDSQTDTVYTAVTKLDDEFDTVYGHLNSLFKLQAAGTCPASGNATYDVCLDTDGPTLTYWTGTVWTDLVGSTTEYSSGLSYANAVVGTVHNATIERDGTTKSVMINATSIKPATVYANGGLFQVTSKITYDFTNSADGTYYVYASQVGSTTAFELKVAGSKNGTDTYLGEVRVSSSGTPASVLSYDQQGQQLIGAFGASRTAAKTLSSTKTKADYVADLWFTNAEFSLSNDEFTPTRAGWYEVTAKTTTANGNGYTCTLIYKNGAEYARSCNKEAGTTIVEAMVYFNGTSDYISVWEYTSASIATLTTNASDNAVWGRWIGGGY